MCGRYKLLATPDDLGRLLDVEWPSPLPVAEELRPTNDILVATGEGEVGLFRWGLVPAWAKELDVGQKLFNARSETAWEKPSFRTAFRKRRCVIPASAFFEWREEPHLEIPGQPVLFDDAPKPSRSAPKRKRKYEFTTLDPAFVFAGLWEDWSSPDGSELRTVTILTTAANATMAPYHDRMPSILAPQDIAMWLDTRVQSIEGLGEILRGVPAEQLRVAPVGETAASPPNSA